METRRKRKIDDEPKLSKTPVKSTTKLPAALKTREKEFDFMIGFLKEKIRLKNAGYLFISGDPGSGKTATVHRAVERLQSESSQGFSNFRYVEINGLFLSEPAKAYSVILEQMTEEIATSKQALDSLNRIFCSRSTEDIPVILFVDELDCIYNKSANVVINILKWHQERNSQLLVISIANDDVLVSKIKNNFSGKIEIDELIFPPYSSAQLEIIVEERLREKAFDREVMTFIMKKSVTKEGDARIALDICGRILDKLSNNEKEITLQIAQKICEEISSDHIVKTIKTLAPLEKVLLRVVRNECAGDEESSLNEKVYFHCKGVCTIEGVYCPSISQLCCTAEVLSRMGFLKTSDSRVNIHSKMKLSIDPQYVNTALHMTD